MGSDKAAQATIVAREVKVADKTGTLFTTVAHILTAMVGAGVLAMPYSLGTLGWVAGPAALIVFYCVALLCAQLLASVYEVDGVTHPKYYEAVAHILGWKGELVAKICQFSNIVLVCIAYTITAAISMNSVANIVCGIPTTSETTTADGCFNSKWAMTIIFGGVQIFFAQLPNIEESWVVSTVGALTAVTYSTIALGLGISKVAQGNHHGTVAGITFDTPANKAFGVLNSLGSMGFAFSFQQILLELEDTIREPPKAEQTMKGAVKMGLTTGALFYIAVATFGYLGLGNAVPEDVLTAFDRPKWLLILANLLVVLHMVAAYNVFAQALFLSLEGYACRLLGLRHPAEEAAIQAAAAALASPSGTFPAAAATGIDSPDDKEEGKVSPPAEKDHDLSAGGGARSALAALDGESKSTLAAPSPLSKSASAAASPVVSGQLAPRGVISARSLRLRQASAGALPASLDGSTGMGQDVEAGLAAKQAQQGQGAGAQPPSQPAAHTLREIPKGPASHKPHDLTQWSRRSWDLEGRISVHSLRSGSIIQPVASLPDNRVLGVAGPFRMESGLRCQPERSTAQRWRYMVASFVIRALFVVVTTTVACVMPFFSEVTGLIGSLTFFPLAIYFPISMYIKVHTPAKGHVNALYSIMVFMLLVTGGATIASIRNIIQSWSSFTFL